MKQLYPFLIGLCCVAGFLTQSYAQASWFVLPTVPEQGSVQALDYDSGYLISNSTISGIFRSPDLGYTWEKMDSGFTFLGKQTRTIAHNDSYWFAGTADGMYRSGDMGVFWEQADSGLPASTSVDYARRIYQFNAYTFALFTDGKLYRSTNNGAIWMPSDSGLTPTTEINALTYIDTTLFAASDTGVLRSDDWGQSWTYLPGPTTNLFHPFIFADKYRLFIMDSTVYYSDSMGTDWQKATGGPELFPGIREGNFSKANGDSIYLSYQTRGVFLSPDNGETWQDITGALSTSLFTLYQVRFAGGSPFVVDYLNGVYKGDIFTSSPISTPLNSGASINAYPNPFTEELALDFGQTGNWQLTLTDLQGKMLHKTQTYGSFCKWKLSELAPGMYHVQVMDTETGLRQTLRVMAR